MNKTQGGAKFHPGANLFPGPSCAHEHGFSRNYNSGNNNIEDDRSIDRKMLSG